MTEPVFDRQILPNGLRVLTADMPQAKSVACFVMLAAGSRYETKETNGIAHFAEHMFFKGTERRPSARELGRRLVPLKNMCSAKWAMPRLLCSS